MQMGNGNPAVAPTFVKKFPDGPGLVPLVTVMAEVHSSFVMGTIWADTAGTRRSRQGIRRQRNIGHLESEGTGRASEKALENASTTLGGGTEAWIIRRRVTGSCTSPGRR